MKLLAAILLLSSCTAQRFTPAVQMQGRLTEVHTLRGGIDSLILLKMGDSSRMVFMYKNRTAPRMRFELQAWYTISCDTTRFRQVNGCRQYEARIKKNL